MKNKGNADVSRRTFLSKGAAVAAVSSIIAIPARSAPASGNAGPPSQPMTNDPVYTESVQTLINKTLASEDNILGTDYLNIKEFAPSGSDITTALDDAIFAISGSGGQILIPRGIWTSKGGHEFSSAISIEGVGYDPNPGVAGTEIRFTPDQDNFMFAIRCNRNKCSLKNLSIDLRDSTDGIGLWMTDIDTSGNHIYHTCVENVGFAGGAFGIKVESEQVDYECNTNRFERVSFIGCQTGFYCNTVNGGFSFDTCYFSIPTEVESVSPAGIALDCYVMGNMSLEHCIFVGNQTGTAGVFPTDGSILLQTTGLFNNISFYDCQDENIQYAYRNTTNDYDDVALVYRNCLIQSKLYFTANGAVLFDSCRLTVPTSGGIEDSSGGYVKIYLNGINSVRHVNYTPAIIGTFVNTSSRVFDDALEVGPPTIESGTSTSYTCDRTRGGVTIPSGNSYITVNNSLVTANSLVFAQLRTQDSGGARISHVVSASGYFEIRLTQNAAANLSVAFKVEV